VGWPRSALSRHCEASDQLGRSQTDRIAIADGSVLFGQQAQSEVSPGIQQCQTWVGLNRIGCSVRPACSRWIAAAAARCGAVHGMVIWWDGARQHLLGRLCERYGRYGVPTTHLRYINLGRGFETQLILSLSRTKYSRRFLMMREMRHQTQHDSIILTRLSRSPTCHRVILIS